MKKKSLKFKDSSKSLINKKVKFRTLKQLLRTIEKDEPKYFSSQNVVSVRPRKKLCDLTSLPARYTCPKTGLYFYDLSVYEEIGNLRHEMVKRIKELRNYGQELDIFRKKY